MECEAITFDVTDHVATITLDRPEAMNSFDGQMGAEIAWAWETVRDTDDIHAVVLRASGDRAFCTGMDIRSDPSWFMKTNSWNALDPGAILSPKLHHRVWKPVVCAVHGLCAGGAQYFLNEADIIICSDDAEFFDPHANGGLVSALEPIGMLARGVPAGDVLRWALMGTEERITPETALRIGLVTEVVPRADLHDRANDIATRIAERNPVAVQGTVRAIWESMDLSRTAALDRGLAYVQVADLGGADSQPRRNDPPRYR